MKTRDHIPATDVFRRSPDPVFPSARASSCSSCASVSWAEQSSSREGALSSVMVCRHWAAEGQRYQQALDSHTMTVSEFTRNS